MVKGARFASYGQGPREAARDRLIVVASGEAPRGPDEAWSRVGHRTQHTYVPRVDRWQMQPVEREPCEPGDRYLCVGPKDRTDSFKRSVAEQNVNNHRLIPSVPPLRTLVMEFSLTPATTKHD